MRDIKFRGKHTDGIGNVYWVYGDLIQYRQDDYRILESFYGQWDIQEGGDEVEPETVGQFTGLHYENGEEVYEGDKVSVEAHYNGDREESATMGAIVFEEGCFMVNDTDEYIELDSSTIKNYGIKKIGTIHDKGE